MLSHSELLQLKRWNTPTIYNGWEQITRQDIARGWVNREETHDFMPQMGPMVGYAVTLVIQPGLPPLQDVEPVEAYLHYIASQPGPKIVVVQDLDKPDVLGSFWGEVNANTHRALGCVGTITDGAIRDLDEMNNAGFKALARRLCVGHAHAAPLRWDCPVEVFGTQVLPGQLIHADKHGFLVIPDVDCPRLLEATRFMDSLECQTVIPAARGVAGLPMERVVGQILEARSRFSAAVKEKYGSMGEW
jgi:regulator of RNase E activity RraA